MGIQITFEYVALCVFFRAYSSIKMAALASDKLRHFPTSPLQQLNGVCRSNLIDTKQIFNVFFVLQVTFCFSGRSVNKDGHHGL